MMIMDRISFQNLDQLKNQYYAINFFQLSTLQLSCDDHLIDLMTFTHDKVN
jgi:hypothetical protein